MERKRPLDVMDGTLETGRPPKTPRKDGECSKALDSFCSSARVSLGTPTDAQSPEARLQKNFRFLFFQGDDGLLDRLQHNAASSVPSGATPKARVEHINQMFRRAAEDLRSRLHSDRQADGAEKAQPLTEKFRAAKDIPKHSPSASKPTTLQQSKLNFAVAKPKQDKLDPSTVKSSFTAASRNTSFNTTGVNTSFWSSRSSPPPSTDDTILTSPDGSSDDDFEVMMDRSHRSKAGQQTGLSNLNEKLREVADQKEEQRQRPESQSSNYLQSSMDSIDIHRLDAGYLGPTVIGNDFAQLEILSESPFARVDFALQWEIQRVLQAFRQRKQSENPSHELYRIWEKPHTLASLYECVSRSELPFERTFLDPKVADFSKLTWSAKLEWGNSNMGPLFNLMLRRPQEENKTCELQRSYGAENVLYLDMPSPSKPGLHQRGRKIEERFEQTFSKPVELLGRRWMLYNAQEPKKKKSSRTLDESLGVQYKLILLALGPASVGDICRYFVDFEMNADSPACKVYSRTDLQASRTTATVHLTPDMIEYGAEDLLATDDLDDLDFMEPSLRKHHHENVDMSVPMNDGCSVISPWLARGIMNVLGDNDRRAWQFRVCGAKGVVVCLRDPYQSDIDTLPGGKHMIISKSQRKIVWSTLYACNPQSLVLNIVQSNMRARNSVLHTGFLPILIDRGVPAEAIYRVVRTQLEQKEHETIQAIEGGPQAIRLWLASKKSCLEELNREKGVFEIGGFPVNQLERMIRLLEAGFDPREHDFLATELQNTMKDIFNHERKSFRISLGCSTTLLGVADMHDCLKPGEIHVRFSQPLKDPVTGSSWVILDGTKVLVARNPAMAPWDIQKVRCVYRPELAHLDDMVVFSSKGSRPLASKLQGGDYDGDTFWVCWDPSLTAPFQNAPVPNSIPTPASLRIKKRTDVLRDFVSDPNSEAQWCKWFCEMALNLMKPNLLGTVSLLYERLIYDTVPIRSKEASALIHLHDYLVDAKKQGYVFTDQDLKAFKKDHGIPSNLPDPWYWGFSRADESKTDTTYPVKKGTVRENIIDSIFLKEVQRIHIRTVNTIREKLSTGHSLDQHLGKFFRETRDSVEQDASAEGKWKHGQLVHLKKALLAVREHHRPSKTRSGDFKEMAAHLQELRAIFENIQPSDPSHPIALEWTRRQGSSTNTWEKLKASAFAHHQRNMSLSSWLLFSVAGKELCELKADEVSTGARHIVPEQYDILRPKRRKRDQLTRERSFQDVETDGEGIDEFWADDTDDDF